MAYLDACGNWLHSRREPFFLTRPELADCAGFSALVLPKLEAGDRRQSRQLAELLAGCYPS